MPLQKYHITGITGGRTSSRYYPADKQFTSSLGVDPDLAIGTQTTSCGGAVPAAYSAMSGANVNSYVINFITCPKTTKTYAVLANGRLVSYNNALASETLLATAGGGNASGAIYYNNYIYIFGTGNQLAYNTQTINFTIGNTLTGVTSGATAKITADADSGTTGTLTIANITGTFQVGETITDTGGGSAKVASVLSGKTDVDRYGPLDQGSPALTGAWWGGLGLTLLTNSTYPSMRLAALPNHWGHVHGDDSLYFCDYTNGQGIINRIHTKKVAYEGDTNDTVVPSAYNVLDLPFGYYPTALCSYSTSLAILAVKTTSYEINQGNASLFIWNPTNPTSFDQQIELPDPIASAVISRDGALHIFTGSIYGGVRVSTYSGGDTVQPVTFIGEGMPPMPGAVAVYGNRLMFGSFCLDPIESACVYALGSRTSNISNDLQNIVSVGTTVATNDQITTAIKVHSTQSGSYVNPQILVAAMSSGATAIYNKSAAGTLQSYLNLPILYIGRKFCVKRIRFPLGSSVISGTIITPYLYYDDGAAITVLPAINNTNYSGKYKVIYRKDTEAEIGLNTLMVQLQWTGTAPTPVMFPIEIDIDVFDDERD